MLGEITCPENHTRCGPHGPAVRTKRSGLGDYVLQCAAAGGGMTASLADSRARRVRLTNQRIALALQETTYRANDNASIDAFLPQEAGATNALLMERSLQPLTFLRTPPRWLLLIPCTICGLS